MSEKKNLEGEFIQMGSYLINSDLKLLIRDRKKETEKKPKKFMGLLENGKFQYVSSLFPSSDNEYQFDYGKEIYNLRLENDKALITKVLGV